MAVCIAVIAKENYPLYIRTATAPNESILSEQNLKYWYTIHTSLDVVEEKTRKTDFKDLYLGLLYLIEDFRIYGYVTNSKIKFLVVIETSNQQYHDTEIKIMFKKLHSSYISNVCNPFYEIGQPITSKRFDDLVKSLMLKVATNPLASSSQTSLTNSTSSTNSQSQLPPTTATTTNSTSQSVVGASLPTATQNKQTEFTI